MAYCTCLHCRSMKVNVGTCRYVHDNDNDNENYLFNLIIIRQYYYT